MRKIFLGCLFLMLSTVTIQARDLTLQQALDLAEQHSFILKKARANNSAAQHELKAAGAERFPTLSLAGNASYISKTAEMDINIPNLVSLQREIGSKERYQTDLRMTVPLFTGGKISSGIDIASASVQYAEALVQAGQDQIDYMTRLEYLNLHRSDRMVEAALAAQKRTSIISDNVKSLYEAGTADSVDLLEARLAVSKAQLAVDQAQTGRRSSEIRLATLLGLETSESLNVMDKFPEPSLEKSPSTLSDSKPELIAAEANILLMKSRRQLARSDYWPSLNAYGGYSYGKPNIDQFNASWNGYWTVGANLSWSLNLFGKTAGKTQAQQYYLEAARSDRDQTRENLEKDINLNFEQMSLAYAAYQNAREQYKIAEDRYRLARQQHSNGVLTTNRLLETEADLTAAEALLAAAEADFYIAQSSYFYALGSDKIGKGF